jgi:hypothetical protein
VKDSNKVSRLVIRGQSRTFALLKSGIVALLLAGPTHAQGHIDLRALTQDLQKVSADPWDLTGVFWVPERYWTLQIETDGSVTVEEAEQILAVARSATVIGVRSGTRGAMGIPQFKSADDLRSVVTITDAAGTSYGPIDESEVDSRLRHIVGGLKGMLVNVAGQVGEHLHFLYFPVVDKDGRRIADAATAGSFTVKVNGQEFKYRLPLPSLLPPRIDPATSERFPGNYEYNPYTGSKLITEPPNEHQPSKLPDGETAEPSG